MNGIPTTPHAVAQIGKQDLRAIGEEERQAIEGWANELKAGPLHRLWLLLLKGHDEVRPAPDPAPPSPNRARRRGPAAPRPLIASDLRVSVSPWSIPRYLP